MSSSSTLCSNCNNPKETAYTYHLKLEVEGENHKQMNMMLCEDCATDFGSLRWITARKATASNSDEVSNS